MSSSCLETLLATFSPEQVLTGPAVTERYFHIWQMDEGLQALAVLLPRHTEDLSRMMQICHQYRQPIVMHGGLTNLVGGTETQASEIVISTERMNQLVELDPQSRTLTVQAGVILSDVQDAAREAGLLFPLTFGAKGSAQIGGIISTNAGGLRVFRYGMTRQLVIGLEVVLADGTVLSSLKKIIKDNSAYDLKQLFIGSEGTLGIITQAVLKLVEAPRSRCSAWIGVASYPKVVELLRFLDQGLAGTLSGFELMWPETYRVQTEPPATVPPPLPYDYPFYVLMESLGSEQARDQQRLNDLLERALEAELILDAAPAQSESDLNWFWQIREEVSVLVSHCRHAQQFDISLPIPHIGPVVAQLLAELYTLPLVERVFAFGHVADGNIHLVVGKQAQSPELMEQINEVVYGPLTALGGSVSAEHGIGLHKKAYLPLSRTAEEIATMRLLKQSLDPHWLLNRGKILEVPDQVLNFDAQTLI